MSLLRIIFLVGEFFDEFLVEKLDLVHGKFLRDLEFEFCGNSIELTLIINEIK